MFKQLFALQYLDKATLPDMAIAVLATRGTLSHKQVEAVENVRKKR
jgi:hypothetical protein